MTRNLYRLWIILLAISAVIALWFSGIAAAGMWKFFRLNARTSAKILNWQIQELSSSRFALEADYQFEIKGVIHYGKTIFENQQFLNRFAAENSMRTSQSKSWQTWYRTSHPTCNSLEKEFPQKQCLQALLTLGVFVYFFFARSMILRLVNTSFG
jgi:hypothetical protein